MRITDIQRFCMHDGPGIRTTVFFKGCPLRCAWCHNPETQSAAKQLLIYHNICLSCQGCVSCEQHVHTFIPAHHIHPERCIGCGACADHCPTKAIELVGTDITAEALLDEIRKDAAFYGENGGVTFSGGECMTQADELRGILRLCKQHHLHTAVDTSGYAPYADFEKILPYTDLFLYDVKCFDAERHKRYVGTDNALILDNLSKLLDSGAPVFVRIPIIPSVNDSVDEMRRIRTFLNRHPAPQKVELIPYHAMGNNKYLALGKPSATFAVPDIDTMTTLRAVFEA